MDAVTTRIVVLYLDYPGKLSENLSEGTSLVVQGLRLHIFNARDLGSIPDQGTRSHMQQLSLHAATTDPTCCKKIEDPMCTAKTRLS